MLSLSFFSPTPRSYLQNPIFLSTNNTRLNVFSNDPFAGVGITSPEQPLVTPAGLRRELMPKHVAVIMDGNRRWARSRGLVPQAGYLAGAGALKVVVDLCRKWGIHVLTVFAFSSDNWLRPKVCVILKLD